MNNLLLNGDCLMADEAGTLVMSQRAFERTIARIKQISGISIQAHKRTMVEARILNRVKALGLSGFDEYLDLLDRPKSSKELEIFCNALTTNLTSFFREIHHFEQFSEELGHLISGDSDRVRIWSAGCSTGQEAYSIAMAVMERQVLPQIPDTRILATDIDTNVLKAAKKGEYSTDELAEIPTKYRRYLQSSADGPPQIDPLLKGQISFKKLNLLDDWPMKGPFDAIFCRNVLIYFSADTKALIISRFAELLRPGGILFLGHSENILGKHPLLNSLGQTSYRRVDAS